MYEAITVFKTSDGKTFEDEKKAKEHIADLCRAEIDSRIQALTDVPRPFTKNELFTFVMKLIPSAEAALSLTLALQKNFTELHVPREGEDE